MAPRHLQATPRTNLLPRTYVSYGKRYTARDTDVKLLNNRIILEHPGLLPRRVGNQRGSVTTEARKSLERWENSSREYRQPLGARKERNNSCWGCSPVSSLPLELLFYATGGGISVVSNRKIMVTCYRKNTQLTQLKVDIQYVFIVLSSILIGHY